MNTSENTIKEWLLPKLEERGQSVEEFANEIGISRASLYFYFTDKCRPDDETMAAICHSLNVPLEEGFRQYVPKKEGRPSGWRKGRS
jgi:transcriptional regulator with XRE-family HTH domain